MGLLLLACAEQRLLVKPHKPRTKPDIQLQPPSSLLDRLQAFLPALQTANAELAVAPASDVVLECGRRVLSGCSCLP